ncbi:hypothetical protein [Saccharicrinis sp. FJH54]|uniref:hypothetical protein n=1 Tax=Saccharicrinis sp. FJH54 TaxID=3344665 RepID=UPI0035D4CB6F
MKRINTFLIIMIVISNYSYSQQVQCIDDNGKSYNGFLFLYPYGIAQDNIEINYTDINKDTVLFIKGDALRYDNQWFSLTDDENQYRKLINITYVDVEYNIFVLKCLKANNILKVYIDNKVCFSPWVVDNMYIEYKDFNKYLQESFPIPTLDNPVHEKPCANSNIVEDFQKVDYVATAVQGDWVKLILDDDSFTNKNFGEDKNGWVRWRNDTGKFILKVAFSY